MGVFDPNYDAITYSILSAPGRGTATVNTAGVYTYTPFASQRSPASIV